MTKKDFKTTHYTFARIAFLKNFYIFALHILNIHSFCALAYNNILRRQNYFKKVCVCVCMNRLQILTLFKAYDIFGYIFICTKIYLLHYKYYIIQFSLSICDRHRIKNIF